MFECEASSLISGIAGTWREEAALAAQRLDHVADLVEIRTVQAEADDPDPGYMIITGLQRSSADIGAALNLGSDAASLMVANAVALRERFPRVRDLLAAGRVDWDTVALVLSRTKHVAESVAHLVDADLAQRLGRWQSWSRRRVIRAIDAAIRSHDPDAIGERETARDRRHVRITPLSNGTARLDAVLSADGAATLAQRLASLIATVCPRDPRTSDQRRADAIATGAPLICQYRRTDCTGTDDPFLRPTRVVIHVLTEAATLAGANDKPALIAGYGVIDAGQLRELANDAAADPVDVHDVALRLQVGDDRVGAVSASRGREGTGQRERRSRAMPNTASTPAVVASTSASTISGG